jgi:hypothetical protein
MTEGVVLLDFSVHFSVSAGQQVPKILHDFYPFSYPILCEEWLGAYENS